MFLGFLWNPVKSDFYHRGFSHSILFAVLIALLLAWILNFWKKDRYSFTNTFLLFLVAVGTHPILDGLTRWGTQLFWPFDIRIHLNSVFVIDPLYTVPFLVFLIISLRSHAQRKLYWNKVGLLCSSFYLVIGLALNYYVGARLQSDYLAPMPLTSLQWMSIEDHTEYYVMKQFNVISGNEINQVKCLKNHHLEEQFFEQTPDDFQIAKKFSQGFYGLEKIEDTLFFYDWRFGNASAFSVDHYNKGLRGYKFYYEANDLKIKRYQISLGSNISLSTYLKSFLQ